MQNVGNVMQLYSYDVENEKFLRSMERSEKGWPRWLVASLLFCASLMWIYLPSAHASGRKKGPSESQRAELLQELTVQIEEAIPYQGARHEPIDALTFRGKMPQMWRVELIAPTSWRTTRLQAKVYDVEHPERPAAFLQVPIKIEVPVYKVQSTLKPGEKLDEHAFELSYTSIYDVPHDAVTSPEQMASKVVKRQINQGKVLCQSMLDDPTIFERGDVVKIRIRRGNVELVDTGMALETGKLNQSARVQSSSTEAVLKGLVSEDGIVY